jgi:hypothetical protein
LLARLGAEIGAVDATSVGKLLSDRIVMRDGQPIVVDESGAEQVNLDGTPTSPQQLYSDWSAKHLWAIKGSVVTGTGSSGSSGSQPPALMDWRKYVGSQSSAADANRLALRDPRAYAEMKRQARAAGAIS